MKRFDLHRPSPAMVVALLALFVAMGGAGYAALRLPNNSVGSQQIKANAVVSSKVKNRSLLAGDFKAGQLPAGPQGVKGDPCLSSDPNCKGPKGDPCLSSDLNCKGPKGDPCLSSDPNCKGPKGDPGQDGLPGTARAYGVDNCLGAPPSLCQPDHVKGNVYSVHVAAGVVCLGVGGATPADSVIFLQSPGWGFYAKRFAVWRRPNLACQDSEFEIETYESVTKNVQDNNNETVSVMTRPEPRDIAFSFVVP